MHTPQKDVQKPRAFQSILAGKINHDKEFKNKSAGTESRKKSLPTGFLRSSNTVATHKKDATTMKYARGLIEASQKVAQELSGVLVRSVNGR